MDDAINVHPVKHGMGLGRLDGVHVNLLPGVSQGEDCWAIAHILLQGGLAHNGHGQRYNVKDGGRAICYSQ